MIFKGLGALKELNLLEGSNQVSFSVKRRKQSLTPKGLKKKKNV
jgi:hypothetical protein